MFDNYRDDPEPGDESDPAYKEELFETYRFMGWAPDMFPDPEYRAEYAAWLKAHE
jgi:hypothetical protein